MTPNPILRVLSTFRRHRVRALLIGGQACIVHGAAEFSRDSDFVVHVSAENLKRLRRALTELEAEPIYFPSLTARHLRRGHACHFRCGASDVRGLRVDLLARLRGCDDFDSLWRRRMEVALPDDLRIPVIGLRDLVQCKKTQRDKDWLMLRRLVDNDILLRRAQPRRGQVSWWLSECRSPEILIELARQSPSSARRVARKRRLIRHAVAGDGALLEAALLEEEQVERDRDREYWQPLRAELESMRHEQRRNSSRRTDGP